MKAYDDKFADDGGDIRWLPYLLNFYPADHYSDVVSTDSSGFRYSVDNGRSYSVSDPHRPRP